jgi:hypothetical protein
VAGEATAVGAGPGDQGEQEGPAGTSEAGSSGAGTGEQPAGAAPGGEASPDPIGQDNRPGDGGERVYEQIYAPQRLGEEGGETVTLPGSGQPGDQVIGEGEVAPGMENPSSVPYVEVYPAYLQAYRQAVESGRVPLHLRSIVREYFSSLEP